MEWKDEEIKYIEANYEPSTIAGSFKVDPEIAKRLNRSAVQIKNRAEQLGLQTKYEKPSGIKLFIRKILKMFQNIFRSNT